MKAVKKVEKRHRRVHPLTAFLLPIIKQGGVGVMPTDTLYGIVARALDKKAVQNVYRLRRRNPAKPLIILISSMRDLKLFGISMPRSASSAGEPAKSEPAKKFLSRMWPGKVSVILEMRGAQSIKKFAYLHRGTRTLAFRLPRLAWLREVLKATGPLVAPSANLEGAPPAKTIEEAKKYFGDRIDFYVDAGRLASKPSTIVRLTHEGVQIIRKGAQPVRVVKKTGIVANDFQ